MPDNHVGISKVGCNCSRQHGDEFCFLHGKGNVKENLREMLPISKKKTEKSLASVGLSGYSVRRTNAIFVRCAIEELIKAQWWVTEETSKMVDVRTKYVFCWSRRSCMYNTYTENWQNYDIKKLIPTMALVNFIWRDQEEWPIERLWPETTSILTEAAKVKMREEIVAEAKVYKRLGPAGIKARAEPLAICDIFRKGGVVISEKSKQGKLPSAQKILKGIYGGNGARKKRLTGKILLGINFVMLK